MKNTETPFELEEPVFHVSHVVADMLATADAYIQLFDRPLTYSGQYAPARRSAGFMLVADAWLELVCPDPGDSPIRRFSARFGDHLHGLAFYVRGIDALAASLRTHGVRSADIEGTPIEGSVPRHGPVDHPKGGVENEPGWWSALLFTHMRDMHGLYEFCEAKEHYNRLDPRGVAGWKLQPLRHDPLGIVRTSHHTLAVPDAAHAAGLWVTALGGAIVADAVEAERGVRSVLVRTGEHLGVVLEFVEPRGSDAVRTDLELAPDGILHQVDFLVTDLDAVRRHLLTIGCGVEETGPAALAIDPAFLHGARYGFTTRDVSTSLSR